EVKERENTMRMSEELKHFLVQAREKLKQQEQSKKCLTHGNDSTLFNNPKVLRLSITIKSTEKMLSMLAGGRIEFEPLELEALRMGELGGIIANYRLRGQLPQQFL